MSLRILTKPRPNKENTDQMMTDLLYNKKETASIV